MIRKSYFTDDELSVLQAAFDLACVDLALDQSDRSSRERLGAVIFDVAKSGVCDRGSLRRQAVYRFLGQGAAPVSPRPVWTVEGVIVDSERNGGRAPGAPPRNGFPLR